MCVKVGKLGESLAGYAAGFDPSVLSPAQAEQVVEQASRIERIAATLKALATGRLAEGGCVEGLGRPLGRPSPGPGRRHHRGRRGIDHRDRSWDRGSAPDRGCRPPR